MEQSSNRGNAPDKWEKLLIELDDKLQLGLLDRLRRIESYHIEEKSLILVPGNADDAQYLMKESVKQQLSVFITVLGVNTLEIKSAPSN